MDEIWIQSATDIGIIRKAKKQTTKPWIHEQVMVTVVKKRVAKKRVTNQA